MARRLGLVMALFLAGAAQTAALAVPYPPGGPGELPRVDPEVTLECEVGTDAHVRCVATGYKSGSDVTFDVAAPASASSFALVPVALPDDHVVLATGTRTSNGELFAQLRFPYPCALADVALVIRSSGHDPLDSPAVLEDSVSTTAGACVEGITLERLRAIIGGGSSDGDVPLARTGSRTLELALAGLVAVGFGSLLVTYRRRRGADVAASG